MKYLVSELFDLVEKQKTKEEKINLLRQNGSLITKAVLHMNYEGNVKFLLPEGEPPFNKEKDKPMGYQTTTLNLELRRFYIFFQEDMNVSKAKREALFISMLEGLHWTEAELICLVKDKNLQSKYPSLTLELVTEAFPDMAFANPLKKEPPPKKSSVKKSKKVLEAQLQE